MYQRVSVDRAEGNGMGLAIAKKHVEQYGGTLDLRSAPGHGATFWFTWPSHLSIAADPNDQPVVVNDAKSQSHEGAETSPPRSVR